MASCFVASAMWASLTEAYQIYATAATAKAGSSFELTLSMKNRNAINTLSCDLVLPAGMTVTNVAAASSNAASMAGRLPEGAEISWKTGAEGTTTITVECDPTVTIAGQDGAVATVTIEVAKDCALGEVTATINNTVLLEANGTQHKGKVNEVKITVEQGGIPGDADGSGSVGLGDIEAILTIMAGI